MKHFLPLVPEDSAFLRESLPCNPVPFLNRMIQLIKEHGTDANQSFNYQANLMIIMIQSLQGVEELRTDQLFNKLKSVYDGIIADQPEPGSPAATLAG